MATISVSNGHSIPVIGFGTGTKWFAGPGKNSEQRDPSPTVVASLGCTRSRFPSEQRTTARNLESALSSAHFSLATLMPHLWTCSSKAFPTVPDVRGCTLTRMGLDYLHFVPDSCAVLQWLRGGDD
ncbi:hypothetical protein BJ742DRAFT_775064 [Cladochytrium replicatum]|nr:hypothetical protein BJ742DRAFT_775064 [Cladochytrium replicatum]